MNMAVPGLPKGGGHEEFSIVPRHYQALKRNYRIYLDRATWLKADKHPMVHCCMMQPLSALRLHHGYTDCRRLTKSLERC